MLENAIIYAIFFGPAVVGIGILVLWLIRDKIFVNVYIKRVKRLISDETIKHDWLAQELADIEYMLDEETAQRLRTKKRPARKAADEVSSIAKEKRELKAKCKGYEYYLDGLFKAAPWLEDYPDITRGDLKSIGDIASWEDEESYEKYKSWLSPKEYSSLPTAKKYQLALERYLHQPKNQWQAGIAYERYVGYLLESNGFSVNYEGATKFKEDRGIDLIAKKAGTTYIVQCKRYSLDKGHLVRENTIAQIYGAAKLYEMEHPKSRVVPAVYTSSALSDEAAHFAEYLKVTVVDNFAFADYPLIKCNVTSKGEKIYHLPFDQQYDKVKIQGKKGAKFVSTVAEAESLGFRRAYRWRPSKED